MSKKLINFVDISKSYGNNLVLDELNLYIRENEFITLLGPSGCGKTTNAPYFRRFETPDKGQVIFDDVDITSLPPNKRNLNTVFQKYALFPHMSIAENIAFGLKINKKSKEYINDKIKYALKLVNLDGLKPFHRLLKRWSAAADRNRTRDRQRAESAPVRRTTRCTGLKTASGYAVRADPPEKRTWNHFRLRHT